MAKKDESTDLKNRTEFVMSRFLSQLRDGRLGKIILNASNMFPSTTLNVNITKLFFGASLYCSQRRPYWSGHQQPYWKFQLRHKKEGENFDM